MQVKVPEYTYVGLKEALSHSSPTDFSASKDVSLEELFELSELVVLQLLLLLVELLLTTAIWRLVSSELRDLLWMSTSVL
jgi:hypothetical protein